MGRSGVLFLVVLLAAAAAWWLTRESEPEGEPSGPRPEAQPSVGALSLAGRRETDATKRDRRVTELTRALERLQVPLVMPDEPSVEVRLLDEDGQPLLRAGVVVERPGLGTHHAPILGNSFRLGRRWLSPGTEIRVDSAQGAGGVALLRGVHRVTEEGLRPITLRLERGRDVDVRVIRERGGPLAHVRVQVIAPPESSPNLLWGVTVWAVTGRDGVAHFTGLPKADLDVELETHGVWEAAARGSLSAGQSAITLVIPEGLTIEGRVVGPDGRGRAGVTVTAGSWHEAGWWEVAAKTEDDGRFILAGLPPAARPRLIARPPMRLDEAETLAECVRDDVVVGSRDVEIRLEHAIEIRGEVVDPSGRSIPAFEVFATRLGERIPAESVSVEGNDSAFVLGGLQRGRYSLEAVARGSSSGRSPPVVVEAPAEGVRIVLEPAAVLRGEVVGERTSGFYAWWRSASLKANAEVMPDGSFVIRDIHDEVGTLYVGAANSDRYALLERIRPSATPLEVPLMNGEQIAGRIVFTEGNQPALVYVVLAGDGFELWEEMQPDGTFQVLGVPPGAYDVSLSVDDERGPSLGRVAAGAKDVVIQAR